MLENIRRKIFFQDFLCTWWIAYAFDNRLRRIFHDPAEMLGDYVKNGMTVLDIGCGMGYFSIGMARLSGKGKVIALDIQEKMLEVMKKRAAKAGILERIIPHLAAKGDLGIRTKVDFALSFWMVHEVPGKEIFLSQVYNALKPGGKYLIVEPKIHTGKKYMDSLESLCMKAGFRTDGKPVISLSRALLLQK